jgi:hypothetical protein
MRIDKRLNLVTEVQTENGTMFVHSAPISREVFEKYFLVISKTFAAIISEGLSFISGPRIAALMLKKVATDSGVWEGNDGVNRGLMAEIRRLSNVSMPSDNGWKSVPFQDVIDKGLMDEADVAEVEGLIAFFICASAMSRRNEVQSVLERMSLWGSSITSLNSTGFTDSLPTLTPEEISVGTEKISSVPH